MKKELSIQIGTILKELRAKNGITVREVAKRMKKAPATVSDHELGKISISLEVFIEYCIFYDVNPSETLNRINYKRL